VASTCISARVRSSLATLLAATTIALVLPGWAAAVPGDPPPVPTVASVTAQLDVLGRHTEVLAEKYNKARIEVAAAQQVADASRQDAASAAAQFQLARGHLAEVAAAAYEGGSFSNTGALLSSNSGAGYLDSLNTIDQMATHQAGAIIDLTQAKAVADRAGRHADALLAAAEAKRTAVGAQRAIVAAETDKFQTLLLTLTAAQQAAFSKRDAAPVQAAITAKSVHAGNAAAQRAVNFALAQVGKPYVFAAAGPDAFDCSGLTMAAWAAGGVSLPHLASSQYDYGTHVSPSQLQPGDLVFLYQPIGHVEIYIGNGLMVSAPQPGENVQIVTFARFASDFAGATRLA